MSMYHNKVTGQKTTECPWGNTNYDTDYLAELMITVYADWEVVDDSFVPTIALTKDQQYAAINTKYSTIEQGILSAISLADGAGLTTVAALKAKIITNRTAWTAANLVVSKT